MCVVETGDAGSDAPDPTPFACQTLVATGATVTVSAQSEATRGNAPGLVTLSGGGVGIAWIDSGTVHVAGGSSLGIPTPTSDTPYVPSPNSNLDYYADSIAPMTNGGFAIGWSQRIGSSGHDTTLMTYDASGKEVLGKDLGSSEQQVLALAPFAGGVRSLLSRYDGVWKLLVADHSATGAITGEHVLPTNGIIDAMSPRMVALDDGSLVVAAFSPENGSGQTLLAYYVAADGTITGPTTIASVANSGFFPIAVGSSGSTAFVSASSDAFGGSDPQPQLTLRNFIVEQGTSTPVAPVTMSVGSESPSVAIAWTGSAYWLVTAGAELDARSFDAHGASLGDPQTLASDASLGQITATVTSQALLVSWVSHYFVYLQAFGCP